MAVHIYIERPQDLPQEIINDQNAIIAADIVLVHVPRLHDAFSMGLDVHLSKWAMPVGVTMTGHGG